MSGYLGRAMSHSTSHILFPPYPGLLDNETLGLADQRCYTGLADHLRTLQHMLGQELLPGSPWELVSRERKESWEDRVYAVSRD
jgi:hypothetical protein